LRGHQNGRQNDDQERCEHSDFHLFNYGHCLPPNLVLLRHPPREDLPLL
jgi:hypothetical protein